MGAIQIRDVPPEVLAALKRRAARSRRSLQKELLQLLEEAARAEPPGEALPPLRLRLSKARPSGDWSRDEIYGDDGR